MVHKIEHEKVSVYNVFANVLGFLSKKKSHFQPVSKGGDSTQEYKSLFSFYFAATSDGGQKF